MFLANLKEHTTTCHWNNPAHSVLNVPKNNEDYSILKDYSIHSEMDIEAAYKCQAATDIRAKQNVPMMHNCIYTLLSEDSKSKYVASRWPHDALHYFEGHFCCNFQPLSIHLNDPAVTAST